MKKVYLALLFVITATIVFAQNPILLKDVYPGATGSGIQQIVKTSNYTFFNAEDDDADTDVGLYRTDGTASGTIKLNLSYPGYNSTKAEKLTALGNKIIFAGDNFANYGEIWASDGTQAGTVALERFQPTLTNVKPVMDMAALGNEVLYGVVNSSNRSLLKKTDGTTAGTSVVYDFSSLNRAMDLALFKTINNILYFNVYDIAGTGVDQLWRSDGTTAGTYMLKDFGLDQYVASGYMPAGNLFYLMIVVPGTGNVLWKSDGTAASTEAVKTIGTSGNNNYPPFAAIGSTLYFAGLDGNGKELWKTDGTAAGTVMVSDINAGTASSNPFFFTLLNGNIYFSATTTNEGAELWKFDGVNTALVKDINPGTAGSAPGSLVVSNNTILFRALTAASGSELWITDGTSANTLQVADINPGVANAVPNILTPGNPVYFSANNGVNGSEIFKFDNSPGLSGLHKLYVNDNSTSGDIFTTAVGNNANQGTKSSPVATVSYAVSIAQAGDTIMVDAGTFTEQVIIDKGITIKGAGQNLTSVLTPSTTLVPARGPFTEIGLIETTQGIGDVHISDLSVTSNNTNPSQNIIIQSGGSVKNCKLLNGGQGIFFRIETGARNALVENNEIEPNGIGVNCQGSGLTAIIINNAITKAGGYYAGIFAGLDFGPLPQLTIVNNTVHNYFGTGMLVNSYAGTYNNNSIVGTGGFAIERTSGNTPVATCNWYGSPLAATVTSKINGIVTYSPWLIDGTDSSPAVGFQSSATCPVTNSYYVNDNSTTGDVFTTAVGNNVNAGTFNAPFATLNHAILQVPIGATIFVDAGNHILPNIGITKALTFLGPNYQTSPNNQTDKSQANTFRNAEAIVSGSTISILSNNISFQGFTFDPGDKFAFALFNNATTNNDFGNFSYSKNILKIKTTTNNSQFSLIGKFVTSPGMPINSGYSFLDNRFEKITTATGSTLQFAYIKNIVVSNNTFVNSGNTVRSQQAVLLGTAGVVDAFTFSDNTVLNASTAIGGNLIANAVISGNKIDNSGVAFNNNTNSFIGSSSIEFSNNSLTNTTGGTPFVLYTRNGNSQPNTSNVFKAENNIVTGILPSGLSNQQAAFLNLTINNSVSNPSLIVQGNKINYSGDFSQAQSYFNRPISVRGNIGFTTINSNEILYSGGTMIPYIPISLPENPAITLTTDATNFAWMQPNALININNNKVQGFKQSLVFWDQTSTGKDSYVGFGNIPSGATVNVNNNSFTGDSISINNGTVSQTANATCNWYGSSAAQNVSPKVTEATVDYVPWLTNGTDTDVATGFQPVANVCNGVPVDADIIASTNVTCNGLANGSIDVFVEDGLAPFTYAWSKDDVPGFSTSEDLVSLAPGFYKLIVTDANGSIDSVFTTITEPALLTASASGTNNLCFAALNGTAEVIADGGTTPYTYLWSNGQTTESISNLAAGNYSVTVTDANGCTALSSYVVTQPALLTAVANGTNVSCFNGSNGTAAVTTDGGTSPYTYLWNNGATSSSITNLAAGVYNVTVTDANGCTASSSYEVKQPALLTAVANGSNVSCFNGSNGTAAVTNGGGTSPYTYLWNNGANTSSINNLAVGIYNVTVTDANGCTASSSYEVKQPALLTAVANGTNVSCFNGSNGTAGVITGGGTTPYTYRWSNGATSSSITNLAEGVYNITVTDANGCTASSSYEVTQPPLLTASINNNSTACSNIATVTAVGGTPDYTYLWSNGSTLPTISGVPVGTYTVTVTDTKGCTITATIILTVAEAFNPSASVTNVTCFGANNGIITVTNANGTGQLMFSKDGGVSFVNGSLPFSFTNLAPGNYNIAVKDVNGCTGFVTKTVTQPTQLTTSFTVQKTCAGLSTGSINVTLNGGSPAYSYSWSGPNSFTSTQLNISNLAAGDYTLTVTDKNNCKVVVPVTVNAFPAIVIGRTITDVACRGGSTGAINITSTGGTGSGFTYTWTGAVISSSEDLNNLAKGTYKIRVTDNGSGCIVDSTFLVNEPASSLALATVKTNATGCGSLLGTITGTGSGGTAPYTYNLNGGIYGSNGLFTGLYAGSYTIGIKDANGCIKNTVVSITDNGNDENESNNSKSQAKLINTTIPAYGRIALSTDVADWFKFTTSVAGTYVLNLSHPSVNYTFNLYLAGNNTAALIPSSPSATSKQYINLLANTTYYIQITGGLSFNCYTLFVAPPPPPSAPLITSRMENEKPTAIEINKLTAIVYPNPHRGSFNIKIASPESGSATIELFTAGGQKLAVKNIAVQKGDNNIVPFNSIRQGTIFYRVHIGKQSANGKVVGME